MPIKEIARLLQKASKQQRSKNTDLSINDYLERLNVQGSQEESSTQDNVQIPPKQYVHVKKRK